MAAFHHRSFSAAVEAANFYRRNINFNNSQFECQICDVVVFIQSVDFDFIYAAVARHCHTAKHTGGWIIFEPFWQRCVVYQTGFGCDVVILNNTYQEKIKSDIMFPDVWPVNKGEYQLNGTFIKPIKEVRVAQ